MFCYNGTCTNTKGDSLVGYFVECLLGTTVQAIFSDNASTPILGASGVANRAKTDDRGNFFFFVADGTYSLKYYDTAGVFQFSQTNFTMVGTDSTIAAAANAAASAASATASAASAATAAAYTSAKTANTATLIAGLRTNGYFPAPLTRAASADIPTVTLGVANANSTINANSVLSPNVPFTSNKFNFLSGVPALAGPGFPLQYFAKSLGAYYGAADAVPNPLYGMSFHSMEFNHTGTTLEIPYASQGGVIRIIVNGAIVSTLTADNSGNSFYIKLVFPSSATRRITVETAASGLGGANAASTSEIASTGRTYPVVTIVGDSFVGTTGTDGYDGEAMVLGRIIGANAAVAGVGSTGMLAPGGNNVVGYPLVNFQNATRLKDLTLVGAISAQTSAGVTPNLGIVMCSINDTSTAVANWGGASNLRDAIRNATFVMIDAWKAAHPTKPLVFYGPTWTNETPLLTVYSIRDGCEEACLTTSNVWFIDRLGAGPILRKGSGAVLSTTGNTTNGSAVVTAMASQTGVQVGSMVVGTGIPIDAVVKSIDSGTQITISANATATGAGVSLTIGTDMTANYAYNVGGDTTHPNRRGHSYDGRWMAAELRHLILNEFA